MRCVCVKQGTGHTLLLFYIMARAWAGSISHVPKIDGQRHLAMTLKENATHRFNCQSEGWNPESPPLLTWYLNGERQSRMTDVRGTERVVMRSQEDSGKLRRDSTLSLRPRKFDRELVCAVSSPGTSESYNATVLLNIQFRPEILRVSAQYSETSDPGLSLVLFALVRSNPPATLTWFDQSGKAVANTSDFLILDSRGYPWLTNHTLRVSPGSFAGNVSVNASNSMGSTQSNLTLTEFLQSRVEVPMLGILTGGAAAFITLLILTLILLCLLHKNKGKAIEEPEEMVMVKKSDDSPKARLDGVFLPRENMSLPSNMQLNDHSTLCKGRQKAKQNPGERRPMEEEEEDLSAAYAARGFARYPMVGYIYKVTSVSSDEIWL